MLTAEDGTFKHGPVDIDAYTVTISKEDYIFTKESDNSNDFVAVREARMEVRVEDSFGVALADVFVTVSSGKTILKDKTDANGVVIFSKVKPQKYYLNAIKKEYSFGAGT